jgi:hypothetical protein
MSIDKSSPGCNKLSTTSVERAAVTLPRSLIGPIVRVSSCVRRRVIVLPLHVHYLVRPRALSDRHGRARITCGRKQCSVAASALFVLVWAGSSCSTALCELLTDDWVLDGVGESRRRRAGPPLASERRTAPTAEGAAELPLCHRPTRRAIARYAAPLGTACSDWTLAMTPGDASAMRAKYA